MIALRKGNSYIILRETKLRMQLTNPLLSKKVVGTEYSFPFTIPASGINLRILGYEALPNTHGPMTSISEGWMLYVDGYLLYEGDLQIYYQGLPDIDVNLLVNSSRLGKIKNIKLKDLDWGADKEVKVVKQNFLFHLNDDYIGNVIILRFGIGGGATLTRSVTSTVFAALTLLAATVNSTLYLGEFVVHATVVGTNEILFEADWYGIEPQLLLFFDTPSGPGDHGTHYLVSALQYLDVFEIGWRAEMLDKVPYKYPDQLYNYFPVLNDKAEVPFFEAFVEIYGMYPFYYQNYYASTDIPLRFEPNVQLEHPDFSGTFGRPTCITPFIYIAYYLDLICKKAGSYAKSEFHSDEYLQTVVAWSNQYLTNSNRAKLSDRFNLKDFTPDLTVEEFLQLICSAFNITPLSDSVNKVFDFVHLEELIDAEIVDWSHKQVTGNRNYTDQDITGFDLLYNQDEKDESSVAYFKDVEGWKFMGVFALIADLPSYEIYEDVNTAAFALVKEDGNIYKLSYNGLTGYTWSIIDNGLYRPEVQTIGNDKQVLQLEAPDTLGYFKGPDPLMVDPMEWKVPYCKQPINTPFYNKQETCKLRLLQAHGWQENDITNDYPFGSADGVNYNGDVISDYSLTWGGDRGYYVKRHKRWIDFILNTKPVEMYFNLNINDFVNLPYRKRIHSNGQYYLLLEVQPELPARNSTLCKLLKIEKR